MAVMVPGNEQISTQCLSAYDIDDLVFCGDLTRIYRGRRRSDGASVILKTLNDESPAQNAAIMLQHEFEIVSKLTVSNVVQVFALRNYTGLPILELEDFGGDSLDNLVKKHRFSVEDLLRIAIQVTQALIHIHSADIIHKDINPSNIVYNPNTKVAKIIDFGISTYFATERAEPMGLQMVEGSLPYISPEQTGRMNRALDYRTDFYSLGATLYELLTGRPVFIVSEPIEWFHCHIAKQPLAPNLVDSKILKPLANIVMKLLSKTAEDRYQSAKGIQADLTHCLDQLQKTGTVAPFSLALQDFSDRFQIPQVLYGRDGEIARLMSSFDLVAQGGRKLVLVSGYSGIGKTSLVKEIYKPITQRRGYVISGKFGQFNRSVPYNALSDALRDLVRQLLTEPEEKLSQWRDKIMDAVGLNGQLVINVISELEFIIGSQPQVAEVSSMEAEQRFRRVIQRFIKVFCGPQHPLVIFLDDLQWIDSASMRLLELMTEHNSGLTHLMFIGAYRDNEMPPSHSVTVWLNEIRRKNIIPLEEIRLAPLGKDDIIHLTADALGATTQRVVPLAEIVAQKTAGNPFFAEEFLTSLYQEKLILFSYDQNCWTWDIARIGTCQITANVVELMAGKFMQLAPDTRHLLELGACIGFRFSLSILAVVSQQTPKAVVKHLKQGIKKGLVAPTGDAYKLLELEQATDPLTHISVELVFSHDRIHQAAYFLLDDTQRHKTHLKIGRLLQKWLPAVRQREKLFDITNHLNLGSDLLETPQDRLELCRLNISAGQTAKQSNAYQPAYNYFQKALALIDRNTIWQDEYDLALKLYVQAAETAYLCGAYEDMERLLDVGFTNVINLLDKINLYLVKISACMSHGQLQEGLTIAKSVLSSLGHHYPETPNKIHLIVKFARLKWCLRGKSMDDLRNLPKLIDPKHLAAEKIGQQIGGAVMFAQPMLLPMMIMNSVQISLKHGLSDQTLTSYAAFGMILIETTCDVERGQSFAKLALDLMQQLNAEAVKGRLLHIYNALVRHWKEPVESCLDPLHEAFGICLENGDFEYAAHAASVRLLMAFESGMELSRLLAELKEYHAAMAPLKQGPRLHYLECIMQETDNLLGNSPDPVLLKGAYYDIEQMLPAHEKSGDKSLIKTDHMAQMRLCYFFRRHQEALEFADKVDAQGGGVQGMYFKIPYLLLDSLVRLADFAGRGNTFRRRQLRRVSRNLKKLKSFAKMNPANCLNKQRLVEAEQMRALGREFNAHSLYDESIRLARKQGFLHEEALANELCGNMHADGDRMTLALPYLAKARQIYNFWGAHAKAKDLEQRFPELIAREHQRNSTTSWKTSQTSIDFSVLFKALKAIAEETVHSRMVEVIISTALQFAGAQQGMLLLRDAKGNLCIEAEAGVDGNDPKVLQSIPVDQAELSQSVINYVNRSRSGIVIHDAQKVNSEIPGLNQDSYIKDHGVKSLLCLPIISNHVGQDDLIGMLYLENNRASGIFTQERFETLEIICLSAAGRLELSRKAVIDGLTELYNHDYFQSILSNEFNASRQHNKGLSLIMIDIDHFKRFNDTWGHQIGDRVLREVARVVKSSCRTGDTVARYGGEEMVVVLPMTPKEKAELVAQRIRREVENLRVAHDDEQLKVTISLGLSCLEDDIIDPNVLLRRADSALYQSKTNGRNRITVA